MCSGKIEYAQSFQFPNSVLSAFKIMVGDFSAQIFEWYAVISMFLSPPRFV